MFLLLLLPIVYACILQNNTFQSEFNYMRLINFQFNNKTMREVKLDENTCEITKTRFSSLFPFQKIENFTCGLEECLKWCSYNNACRASLYSDSKKLCMRFSYLEIVDTTRVNYNSYHSYKPRVFYKGVIPFGGGLCDKISPKDQCEVYKRCKWNSGKISIWDEIQGGSAGGYCGRISCSKKVRETGT